MRVCTYVRGKAGVGAYACVCLCEGEGGGGGLPLLPPTKLLQETFTFKLRKPRKHTTVIMRKFTILLNKSCCYVSNARGCD